MSSPVRRLLDRAPELRVVRRILPHLVRAAPFARWNASRLLAQRAKEAPDAAALRHRGKTYSWAEIDDAATRCARVLRERGVDAGSVVGLLMDNRPEYLIALSAISRLRAVAALINTNVTGAALTHALTTAGASHVVVGIEHAAGLADVLPDLPEIDTDHVLVQNDPDEDAPAPPPVAPGFPRLDDLVRDQPTSPLAEGGRARADDLMCFIYTSGTTGLPKAAVVKNSRFLMGGAFYGTGILDLGPDDVVYVALPLYHTNALFAGWSAALATGASIALSRRFSASSFWPDVRATGATAFLYIGEMCRYLLNQPPGQDDARHRVRIATGNGLRPDIWEEFQERFRIPMIREFYGATEGNVILVNLEGRPGMVGRLTGNQVIVRCDPETGDLQRDAAGRCTVVDEGETGLLLGRITRATPYDGYLDANASRKKIARDVFRDGDAYFDTGDLMTLHADGWVSFADRLGDTFRWKGENVSTTEVAETLNGIPGVLESTVYGVEVPGADGRAGMVALARSDEFSIDVFARHVEQHLTRYQRPYFVRLLDEMATTGTFKQRKAEYRREGYDPAKVDSPLFVFDGRDYVPLTKERFAAIQTGEIELR